MSIRTHIPWINFSGSSTKFVNNGCGNSSYNYSAFSGLGTRDFNFTHISNQNSCGHNSYGCGNYGGIFSQSYGSLYGQSSGGYIRGYTGGYSNSYYSGYSGGHCHGHHGGRGNWFTKFSQIMSGITMGLSMGNWLGGLFSSKTPSSNLEHQYYQQKGNDDGTIYRQQEIITITKEKDDSGEYVYKVKKETVKVKSEDGSTEPLKPKINNKAGVFLNEKNEIVWQNQITKTIKRVWNEEKQVYEDVTTTVTKQVPSKDGKTNDIITENDQRNTYVGGPKNGQDTGIKASSTTSGADDDATDGATGTRQRPGTDGATDGATGTRQRPGTDGATDGATGTGQRPGTVGTADSEQDVRRPAKRTPTRDDLDNPVGLDKIKNQKLKATIENYITTVKQQIDNLKSEMQALYIDFNVDYSNLPVLTIPENGQDYDEGEIVKDYRDSLSLWLADIKVDASAIRATRPDISFNFLKSKYPNISDTIIRQALDDNGNNREKADAELAKLSNQ